MYTREILCWEGSMDPFHWELMEVCIWGIREERRAKYRELGPHSHDVRSHSAGRCD